MGVVDPAPHLTPPWGRTDPRARLLATCVVSATALAARAAGALLLPGAAAAALFALSRTSPAVALGTLRPFRVLLAFTFALQALLTPGEPLAALGPLAVTGPGLAAALLAVARLGLVIVVSAHLVATTSPLLLARSLGWVFTPLARLGVPVRDAELVLALGFRFVPALREEGRQVRAALESRGISARHPRRSKRLRAVSVWLLAVLFGMLDRSGRLAAALEARGFALPGRTRPRFAPWNLPSTLLGLGSLLLAAAALAPR